uniref:Uncharacterized protein n=1 Tax=Siphoviridae sp. ctgBD49 TaxID=2826420 RepID=A0A8S5QQQ9_9CAUD|nr:MAG TPA: hypothetical protein [Siphoviridae sp. ctgBD49]
MCIMMAALSQLMIFGLTVIACAVVIQLGMKRNAWKLIILYWTALTIKNLVDYISIVRV